MGMTQVLVVDGDANDRSRIAGVLEEAGLAVQVADDPSLALSSGDFDVVVSASDPPREQLLAESYAPVVAVRAESLAVLPLLTAIRDLTR